MRVFDKEMRDTGNGWTISIGGIRGTIYKEDEGRYSVEYLEKYVKDGFMTKEGARVYLQMKFKGTQRALNGS